MNCKKKIFFVFRNYEQYFEKALKIRRLIAEDFYRVFRGGDENRKEKVDVLLTPATLSEAPLYSEWKAGLGQGYERERKDDYFTQPVNMAGMQIFFFALVDFNFFFYLQALPP